MNSAAFGGWWWKRTHEARRGKFSLRSRGLDFLPMLALVIPLPSLSNRVRRYAASRHTPVAFESVSRQARNASAPSRRRSAEFISPARQGWESRFGPEAPEGRHQNPGATQKILPIRHFRVYAAFELASGSGSFSKAAGFR